MISDLIIYTPMYVTLFWALIFLISKHSNNSAKQFLGIFMVAAFTVYLSHAVFFQKHNNIFIYFDPLYNFASLSVYPLYYWYIKLLTSETHIKLRNLRLLIPALFFGLATFVVYLFMTEQEREYYINTFLFEVPTTGVETILVKVQRGIYLLSRFTFLIQVIVFLILGSKLVKRYNSRIANFYSNLENRTILWVKLLLISFIVTSFMSMVFNFIGREVFFDSSFLLVIPSAIFSILLFFIGFQGHLQNYTVVDLIEDENQHPEFDFKETNQKLLKEKLVRLFEEEAIYRNYDLKMTRVSMLLQTNRTYISNIINSEFSCSFSEFVNRYRIKEAKNILTDFSYDKFSLSHISDEVGFGSLHTFIRVFKEQEGVPPGKYRQKFLQKNRTSLSNS